MKEIRHKKNKIKPKKINLIKNQIKMKTKMKINNLIKTKKERMNFQKLIIITKNKIEVQKYRQSLINKVILIRMP